MKHKLLICLSLIFLLLNTGCDLFRGETASSEAEITSFTFDGIVGSAEIDSTNRTIIAAAEPMSTDSIDPVILISDKATITEPDTILDDQVMTYIVTAENGDEVNWTVLISVEYGITVTLGDTVYTAKYGYKEGIYTHSDTNEVLLTGTPMIMENTDIGYYEAYAFEKEYSEGSEYDSESENILLRVAFGIYNGDQLVTLELGDYNNFSDLISREDGTQSLTYTAHQLPELGEGDGCVSFSGTVMSLDNTTSINVTGFIKAPVTKWYDWF